MSWPQVNLSDVCEINVGRTPPRKEERFWKDGVHPWASISDLGKQRELHDTKERFSEAALNECKMREVKGGTVLFSFKLSIGKVGIAKRNLFTNEAIAALPPKREDQLYAPFLARALEAIDFSDVGSHAVMGRTLNKKSLETLKIPLPPLEEQKRIAQILDQADALRRLRTRALDKLNTLGQAIFHEMFGDPKVKSAVAPMRPLGELLEAIDSGKSPKCLDRPACEAEAGVLKLSAVTSGSFIPEENKSYEGCAPLDPRHQVHDGDLLFTRKNTMALVAAVALVRGVGDRKLYMPDLIFRLRPKTDAPIRLQYLRHLLGHPAKRAQIQALAGGAAGSMPNISKAKLINVAIPVPPMDTQISFESRLAQCEKNKGVVKSSLDKSQALFASLQHRAFRGEL